MSYFQTLKQNKEFLFLTIIINILVTFIILGFLGVGILEKKDEILKRLSLFSENIVLDENNKEEIQSDKNDNEKKESETQNFVSDETRTVQIVEKVSPAVVSIVITKDVPIVEQYNEQFNPFEQFFGPNPLGDGGLNFQIPQYRQKGTEKKEVGGGSGFLVSKDGLIVTNKHVIVDDTASYTALTNDGKKHEVTVVAKDPVLDVAILKMKDGDNYPYLEFGDSDKLKAGQTVVAIGNALGEFRNSVSVGVISGLSRSIVAGDGRGATEQLEEVIQTDAGINPGNSGGPLLNLSGKVIGVNVAVASGSENIAFALPANSVKGVVESVKSFGEIVRPYIGVRYIQVNSIIKEKNNLSVDYGALVLRGEKPEDLAVIPGSPADKAGIVENDIILEIDKIKLDDEHSLASLVRKKKVGDTIKLKILHQGKEKFVDVKLEKAPNNL